LQLRAQAILADGRLAALNRVAIQACDPDRTDLEIGRIDFTKIREIVARWPEGGGVWRTEPQDGR
jgi:hypothetical protein